MTQQHLSQLFFVIVTITLAIFTVSPAHACSPSEDAFNYTLDDQINDADLVLSGTVTNGYLRNYNNSYEVIETAIVEVEQYFKGAGSAEIEIHGFGDGADCLAVVNIGQEYLFFVDEPEDGRYVASYISVHDATMVASDDMIASITNITGMSNDPQPLSVQERLAQQLDATSIILMIIGFSVITGGVAITRMMASRHGRKSKAKRG